MNIKRLAITYASLSLPLLILSNCASIKELRDREDPYATVTKKKIVKTSAKKKKKSFFSFFDSFRKKSTNTSIATRKKAKHLAQEPQSSAVSNTRNIATAPTAKPRLTHHYRDNTSSYRTNTSLRNQKKLTTTGKSRRVSGLITPDAGKLPNSKDLQEVQAPSSLKKGTPGINIPAQP